MVFLFVCLSAFAVGVFAADTDASASGCDRTEYMLSKAKSAPEIGDESVWFVDVAPEDWFYDAVNYVAASNIFNGVHEHRFAPLERMTRAMLVTTLWRMSGEPTIITRHEKAGNGGGLEKIGIKVIEINEYGEEIESPGEMYVQSFSDVGSGAWYEDAVYWAASHGIVTGYPDSTFRPDTPLNREQLATILYRYSVWSGRSVATDCNLGQFPDAQTVSSYAYTPMCWACGVGLINGVTRNGSGARLSPGSTATRAQTATILMRFCESDPRRRYVSTPEILPVWVAAEA